MRCDQCQKSYSEDRGLYWQDWVKVMNFIEFIEAEGDMSPSTCNQMVDAMMTFKHLVLEADDAREGD